MSERSARLGLPYIQPGQAQKELFHNEALALLDAAAGTTVEAVGESDPPATPVAGQCWALGNVPAGAWAGHGLALAAWTDGGWRFVPTAPGTRCWSLADGAEARRTAGGWTVGEMTAARLMVGGVQVVGARGAAIAAPAGGGTVDGEARAAIAAVLATLRAHGLIAA